VWRAEELPSALQGLIRGPRLGQSEQEVWTGRLLGAPGRPTGVLIVGFEDADAARRARNRLLALATDGHLALDNAQLFDGTRARATDAARRGIAADLHDGVAQSLAHLRMELELLARDEAQDPELGRLAMVAGTALADLRGMIAGLREATDHDLAAVLTRHVDAVTSANGPAMTLRCDGANQLDPARNEEVVRIAQEAISNALRHAQARSIGIGLQQDEVEVRLLVTDDGVGFGAVSPESGGGVGLASMHDRARALHGTLEIEPREQGGTRVLLTVPVGRTLTPPTADAHPLRRRTDRLRPESHHDHARRRR
jgi:signal transduction histidine kinase